METGNAFFYIEICDKGLTRETALPHQWWTYEMHSMLWTARSRYRAMEPAMQERVRIIRCNVLSDLVLDALD